MKEGFGTKGGLSDVWGIGVSFRWVVERSLWAFCFGLVIMCRVR